VFKRSASEYDCAYAKLSNVDTLIIMNPTSEESSPILTGDPGSAQKAQGLTWRGLVTAIACSTVANIAQLVLFAVLRSRLAQI